MIPFQPARSYCVWDCYACYRTDLTVPFNYPHALTGRHITTAASPFESALTKTAGAPISLFKPQTVHKAVR